MSLVDRVRAALDGLRQLREIEMFGGVVFEWDGDPLVGVVDDELIVRVPSGWETAAGDLDELIRRAADVVIAECVVRWHAQLRAGGDDAPRPCWHSPTTTRNASSCNESCSTTSGTRGWGSSP